jgi:hypothetical protein
MVLLWHSAGIFNTIAVLEGSYLNAVAVILCLYFLRKENSKG